MPVQGNKNLNILAVVAARAGSKGVSGKNLRPLLGKPLIVHTLDQMLAWKKYQRFIVSTDSREIAALCRSRHIEVPFERPAALAGDEVGKMEVLRHAFIEAEKHFEERYDALLDLDATAPVRTLQDIDQVVQIFKAHDIDCVFSVTQAHKNPYFNMIEEVGKGEYQLCKIPKKPFLRRQDVPKVYEMNASIYLYKREFLLNPAHHLPYSGTFKIHKMDEDSAFDIDRELDFKLVEEILKMRGAK